MILPLDQLLQINLILMTVQVMFESGVSRGTSRFLLGFPSFQSSLVFSSFLGFDQCQGRDILRFHFYISWVM